MCEAELAKEWVVSASLLWEECKPETYQDKQLAIEAVRRLARINSYIVDHPLLRLRVGPVGEDPQFTEDSPILRCTSYRGSFGADDLKRSLAKGDDICRARLANFLSRPSTWQDDLWKDYG